MASLQSLEFEPSSHTYTLNGRRLPSVTQVLEVLDPVVWTPALQEAADRGTLVHDACEYHDEGTLCEEGVSEEIHGYLLAYRRFRRECPFEIIHTELQFSHPTHRYAGRIDRVVSMAGGVTILDIKSGVERRTHPIQIAAYAAGYKDWPVGRRGRQAVCLYLRADGSYTTKWIFAREIDAHFADFLAALRVYQWRQR